jgi:hypothetical protein
MNWRKSSFSNGSGTQCVELAETGDGQVAIRNSNRIDDGVLIFDRSAIGDLVQAIKAGELDDLA